MSATPLDILIRAKDDASRVINGVSTSGKKLDSTLDSTAKTTGKMGGFFSSAAGKLTGLLGVAYGAKQAFDFGADAIKSAEDAKRSMDSFTASLERTGQTADINEDKFNDWLQSMGESIGQDDEDLRDLATSLTSAFDFSKLKGDATQNLMLMTSSIQDIGAATAKPAGLIKRMFLTLANDPEAAITQFQKLGVITEDQADHFKSMAEKGRGAAVTQKILTLTGKQYGGAAAANTTASDKLATVWGNMKEALGNFLLPLFTGFVDVMVEVVSWVRDVASGGDKLKATWDGLGAGTKTLLAVFGSMIAAFAVYKGAMIAWSVATKVAAAAQLLFNAVLDANIIGIIALAVVALAAVIIVNWDKIKAVTMVVWGAIKAFFVTIWHAIRGPVLAYFNFYKAIFKVAFTVAKAVFNVVKGVVIGAFNAIKGPVVAYFNFYKAIFRIASSVAKSAFNTVKSIVVGAWHGIQSVWNGAKNFFTGIWDGVKNAASSAFGFIRNLWNSTVGGFGFTIPDWVPIVGGKEFRIPFMAEGGIVTGPTLAMIGEAGPEAVVPLGRLGGGLGGGVVVNVYGSVLTEGQLVDKIDEGLSRKRRRNGVLALDRR